MNWAVIAIAALAIGFLTASLYPLNTEYPTIFIESPRPYSAEIYQETSVPIKVKREFSAFETENKSVDIYYSLDGGPKIKLNITRYGISSDIFGVGTLENLTDGYHTVEAFSTDTQGNIISHAITFLVNTTARFPAFLISPMNITYHNKKYH